MLLGAAACADGTAPPAPVQSPLLNVDQGPESSAEPTHILPLRGAPETGRDLAALALPMIYHGGPVLLTPKVQAVYWSTKTIFAGGPLPGTIGPGTADGSLVGYFTRNIGVSSYFNINTTYYNAQNQHVPRQVTYTSYWAAKKNAPVVGQKVTSAQMKNQLIYGFTNGKITYDPGTVYVIFTDSRVNLGGGFGSSYCAYHGTFNWNGQKIIYAAMPYQADFVSRCATLAGGSPNNDLAGDAEIDSWAHELEESVTDPLLNAWYDAAGNENADKCVTHYGTLYTTPNGAKANMVIGTKNFMVQGNWLNTATQGCAITF